MKAIFSISTSVSCIKVKHSLHKEDNRIFIVLKYISNCATLTGSTINEMIDKNTADTYFSNCCLQGKQAAWSICNHQ